jgi:DeoR family transcriptional regulator, suf operon transcriptional repressor
MASVIQSDRTILDLLRQRGEMTVAELETALGVTATAVRQRLNRLLDQGYVEKRKDPAATGRGRPHHCYGLTRSGLRKVGTNFSDLAIALWQEVRAVEDPQVRRGLLQRIASRLADGYRDRVEGRNLAERMESLAELFGERQIPFAVEAADGQLPVLTALACPYPDLAEQDRSICAMERIMVSDVLGERVVLDQCRLDGAACCTFAVSGGGISAAEQ